ncbi:unnamed protein product [Pleuronectes platessa]|uniref:Uncharacterized protein n=1 Tax=Pleuronectes platessa TaxID=8262 RepID=A0A9N7VAP2_PLEPL|nr:unnamed protein product [Pleuronectes platessa]
MINIVDIQSDSIEDYIQTGSSNVESANQELAKANHYQAAGYGELSRDRAHTEQFSSPPIQAVSVIAERLNVRKTTKEETERRAQSPTDGQDNGCEDRRVQIRHSPMFTSNLSRSL